MAAIIIAILVVGGLVGVFLFVLRSRDWEVRRLLPPSASSLLGGTSSSPETFSNIAYNSSKLSSRRGKQILRARLPSQGL